MAAQPPELKSTERTTSVSVSASCTVVSELLICVYGVLVWPSIHAFQKATVMVCV